MPTSWSASSSAPTISVALGSSETMRTDGIRFPLEARRARRKRIARSPLARAAPRPPFGPLAANVGIFPRRWSTIRFRVSDLRYIQALLGKAPALAFAKDVDGRYVYVNEAWITLLGFPREAVLGHTDHDLFPREIADSFVENDRRVLATGQLLDTEEVTPSQAGMRVGHATKFPLRDDAGGIIGVGAIVVDITERHAALKALERSEKRYRQLVEHSPDVYVVLDPKTGKFIDVN